ncbi:MAG: 30S ribosomal protein S17 [Anaerolineales bacterium]|nr:30S ribosomal protein S17 [Anaerolineales bacterium]MCZ7548948.1 30S ribosomal protein S17 [Anaerolineales bacterium]MDX9937575.1 30S ribosomal protein S17 [Anaerolineales bacterium]
MTGVVTSNKMDKTVVVEIRRVYRHPLYKKVVHSSRRVKAHDEIGCQMGDEVQIVESRPLSRGKRWAVETVVKREIRTADAGVEAVSSADVDASALSGVEEKPESVVEAREESGEQA